MEFDAAKGYKRIGFREDRDLLDSELNELQEIAIHERSVLLDRLFAPGSIVAGLDGSVAGDTVTLDEGVVYLDGHAVSVPEATLELSDPGIHTLWLDVFRRIITVADDPTLVNPLTGEPTAEREKWIATLQTRDTTHDPWPEGAIGRTVVAVYTFNRDTGELLPAVPRVVHPDDPAWLAAHIGHGGAAQHPVVTPADAGFMAPADKTKLDQVSLTTPPTHVHDDRYYTEAEVDAQLTTKSDVGHQHDARYAPLAHVGAAGAAHPPATADLSGFLSAADKAKLDGMAAGSTRGQRTTTLVVAASTASAAGKAAADYVCDGVDDQVELNAARAALQALGGGKLVLTEGTFTLSGVFQLCSHLLVEGQGQATVLKVAVPQSFNWAMVSTDDEIDPTPTNITLRDLAFDGSRPALPPNSNGASALHFGGVDGGLLENLDVAHCQYAGTAIYVAACTNVISASTLLTTMAPSTW